MLPICRDAHYYFEPPHQNKTVGVMTPIHHPRMSHPFQGEGDPLWTQGEGAYQSVTSTKGRGSQGEGAVMSHPFQEGVGAVMSHPKRGGGTVMSHPKRGDWGGGGLHQSHPRGWVGGQIMLMCTQSPYTTTILLVSHIMLPQFYLPFLHL